MVTLAAFVGHGGGKSYSHLTMGKLTTHVLDTSAGTPAAGLRIELHARDTSEPLLLTMRRTAANGRCEEPLLQGSALHAGRYSLTFHVGEYFRAKGIELASPAFLDEVVVSFGIAQPEQDYHVPLLVSPWSYSVYRGS